MDSFKFVLSFLALALLLHVPRATAKESAKEQDSNHFKGIIGAVIDESSRIGKEERLAMEIAVEDFYSHTNQSLVLHIKDSGSESFQLALAAKELIDTHQVQAILGLHTWEEVLQIAETSSQNQIPILSFADTIPKWTAAKWPFLLQASPDKYAQMKAIAAIVQSWDWHKVTIIYEDSMATEVIPHLYDALREVGTELSQFLALSPFASPSSLSKDLEALQKQDCRVFLVHASISLATRLFEIAKNMKMMEKDYVWITTDPITSIVHSFNSHTISLMQGIVGIKSYFPETSKCFQDFYKKFRRKFSTQYPEEDNNKPGIFAVQAYDALRTLALSIDGSNFRGKELLERVLLRNFDGLSGKVQFINQKVAAANIFQIINIMEKCYRELGFWSNESGFSKTIDKGAIYNSSMKDLWHVFWPGGPLNTPSGGTVSASANPLKIGVLGNSSYDVKVESNHLGNNFSFTGFAIDVFKAIVGHLPFYLPYNFTVFNKSDNYTELVQQVHLKKFDAVVDVAIVSNRYQYAEFTLPYTETGLTMIVPTRSTSCNAWLFIKPFTTSMWGLIAAITIFNGFVVWLIERNHYEELRGSPLNQIGVLLSLSFTTLFSLRGEKLHNNLSRMTMVAWLFISLVITQTYTANLASVLTIRRLGPTRVDANAKIGYYRGSFAKTYLEEVLHYDPERLKPYKTIDEFAEVLKKKEIAAAFFEAPLVKLFLEKYCTGFTIVGPTYKVGGFRFAFPKGSPLLASMNEALLKVTESGVLLKLANEQKASYQCKDEEIDEDKNHSLGPDSLRIPFIITGATSSVALVIYIFQKGNSMLECQLIWRLMLHIIKKWRVLNKNFDRRVRNVEIHGNSSSSNAFNVESLQV